MSALQTFRIAGPNGHVRVIRCHTVEIMRFMRTIGLALYTAEVTTRPAYREMINTIRWEDLR